MPRKQTPQPATPAMGSILDEVRERAIGTASLIGDRAIAWVSNAIERRLSGDSFIAANQTPFELIHQNDLLSVRKYPPLAETEIVAGTETYVVRTECHRVPVLLVPPLAADPLNFDLLPNRSLVRFLLAQGFQVYLADFGSPDDDHSHLGLADYTTRMLPEALARVRADSGEQEVTLMGYCMGGLFCLVYAGWSHDANIRNIITIASPIDAHQAGIAGRLFEVMNKPLRLAARYVPLRLDDINPRYLRIPGWMSSVAFKLTNPMGTVQGYIDLLMNLWDREYITEYQTMSTWFNKMHDYPGGIIQDFVLRVGLDNQFAKGNVNLGSENHALLDRIDCSLLAIAGKTDKIVTLEAARKVMDIVASQDRDFIVAPGGHAGVFAGSKAPGTTWLFAADWLSTRSD
jgi:polyhydroxyalkanoate synthase subunit PhaC